MDVPRGGGGPTRRTRAYARALHAVRLLDQVSQAVAGEAATWRVAADARGSPPPVMVVAPGGGIDELRLVRRDLGPQTALAACNQHEAQAHARPALVDELHATGFKRALYRGQIVDDWMVLPASKLRRILKADAEI